MPADSKASILPLAGVVRNEGRFQIATIPANRYAQASRVISNEPPPRNGKDRCQDWTLNCILGLEADELIPDGPSREERHAA